MYVSVRVLDPLELELQIVVYCLWVLAIEPGTYGRGDSALNHQTISPAPTVVFWNYLLYMFNIFVLFHLPKARVKSNKEPSIEEKLKTNWTIHKCVGHFLH